MVPELRVFSDGESKIRIPTLGGKCILVQSTYPPVDTHLFQTMMIARKCADDGAEVCAVVPYLAYARQDKAFLEGELPTISLIARLFASAGIGRLMTVDIHSMLGMSYFNSVKIENISSIPLLAEYAKRMDLHDPIAVSPDAGGADRAEEFARRLGCGVLVLKKSRNRSTGDVTVEEPGMDLKGRDCLLIDDMISSGGSIMKAAQALRKKGSGSIYAMCAHALMLGDSSKRLKDAGVSDVVATNSIPGEYARVDLAPLIAEALQSRYNA